MDQINKPDYRFRVVIIGDQCVGKSALLSRFTDDVFSPKIEPTIGIDFKTKTIEIDGFKINVQLWDTAGQERFNSITSSYYKTGQAVILTFDLSKRVTFDNITKWYTNVSLSNPKGPKILVGTKCDLVRQVSQEEIDTLCKTLGISYVETSSKNNINIDTAIIALCSKLLVLYKDDKIVHKPVIILEPENSWLDGCYC